MNVEDLKVAGWEKGEKESSHAPASPGKNDRDAKNADAADGGGHLRSGSAERSLELACVGTIGFILCLDLGKARRYTLRCDRKSAQQHENRGDKRAPSGKRVRNVLKGKNLVVGG